MRGWMALLAVMVSGCVAGERGEHTVDDTQLPPSWLSGDPDDAPPQAQVSRGRWGHRGRPPTAEVPPPPPPPPVPPGPPPVPPAADTVLAGSTWRYWDGDLSPTFGSAAWAYPSYDDGAWPQGAGPLGYGEPLIATTLPGGDHETLRWSAYFRHAFQHDGPSVRSRVLLHVLYDDGIRVHLNGNNVFTAGFENPWHWIHPQELAAPHEATAYQTIDLTHLVGTFRPGRNTLGVQVHQDSTTSDDLVFDLALDVDTPPVCAVPGAGPGRPPTAALNLRDLWVGPESVVVAGPFGTVGRLIDGADWCWGNVDPAADWLAVWGSADDDVWLVGSGGRVARFDGTAFTPVDAGVPANVALTDVWGSGPDDVWVVGQRGTVRHFDGSRWTAHDLLPSQTLLAVWSASPEHVWIAGTEPAPHPDNDDYDGSSGLIFRWQPAARAFELEHRHTRMYGAGSFRALHGSGPEDVWAIGSDQPAGAACSVSMLRRWNGQSWSTVPGAPTECNHMADLAVGAPGAEGGAWVVGEEPWRYTGAAWSQHAEPLAGSLSAISSRGHRMWAIGAAPYAQHKILRWDGSAWARSW